MICYQNLNYFCNKWCDSKYRCEDCDNEKEFNRKICKFHNISKIEWKNKLDFVFL